MKGTWDPKKGKYVKTKKETSERKWIHKNNYFRTKYGLIKGINTPYVKPTTPNDTEDNADGKKD